MQTTISISKDTYQRLHERKRYGKTYDGIISELLDIVELVEQQASEQGQKDVLKDSQIISPQD